MSAFSDAFSEVVRAVQPGVEPVLTMGNGTAADATKEVDSIILGTARATLWTAGASVGFGDVIVPTTGNGRRYRVTIAGTLGSTEPTWPTYDYGSVPSGTATLEEDGYFRGSVYDVRAACLGAVDAKLAKAQTFADVGSVQFSQIVDNLKAMRERYRLAGVA